MTSAWWFKNTEHIVPNHLVTTPHPNVAIVKKCTAFKVEFVVRAYLTGSTSTSIWMHYKDGVRSYCGHKLPDGESAWRAALMVAWNVLAGSKSSFQYRRCAASALIRVYMPETAAFRE